MSVNSNNLADDMLLSLDALEGVDSASTGSKSDSGWWDTVLEQAAIVPPSTVTRPSDDDLIADLRETLADRSSMGFQPVRSSNQPAAASKSPVIQPKSEVKAASVQPAAAPATQLGTGWNPMLPSGEVWNDFTVRDRLLAKLIAGDLPALRDIDIYVERGVISIRAVVVASAPMPMPAPFALPPVATPTNVLPQVGAVAGWGFPPVPQWPMSPMINPAVGVPTALQPVAPVSQPQFAPHTDQVAPTTNDFERPNVIAGPRLSAINDEEEASAPAADVDSRSVEITNDNSTGSREFDLSSESDDAVRDRILASLQATQIPGLMQLQVAVNGHSITLSGSVASDYERQFVLQMVRRECDAWHVRNGIAVVVPKAARFAKLVEFSRDVWHVYRKEVLTIAALILVAVGYVFPWPTFAPAATYPVTTEAVFEKEPMSGATIILHPSNWKLPGEACPVGKVDPRGKVTFSTFGDKDGVPAGEYVVTARWMKLITTPDGDAVPGPNVIPPVFADPATSPIRFRVAAKQTDVVPIVFSNKIVSRNQ